MRDRKLKWMTRMVVSATLILGFATVAAVPRAHAESEEECQRRIARADQLLHIAINKNGPRSEDAERRRHQLREARERCWREFHRWWDEDEHRWHQERDWDEHDHDRDHY